MKNYLLKIRYDGTNYSGWQIQSNAMTVQQLLVDKIKVLLKEDVNLIGSGRTDSGVHALGQIANFRTEKELNTYKFIYQMNAILPHDVSIIEIKEVHDDFHARYDARKRSYIYLFSKTRNPFLYKYSNFLVKDIDVKAANEIARGFLGEHDFTSFCRKDTETINKICNIYCCHFRIVDDVIIFHIEASRFLHTMVRTIIGTILLLLEQNKGSEEVLRIIHQKDRCAAGEAVPEKGLFLYKVKY